MFVSIFYQKPDRYYMYIVNMQIILESGGISLLMCEAMMSRRTSPYYLVLFRLRDVNGVTSCDATNPWRHAPKGNEDRGGGADVILHWFKKALVPT